jgi:hypothetical protein
MHPVKLVKHTASPLLCFHCAHHAPVIAVVLERKRLADEFSQQRTDRVLLLPTDLKEQAAAFGGRGGGNKESARAMFPDKESMKRFLATL